MGPNPQPSSYQPRAAACRFCDSRVTDILFYNDARTLLNVRPGIPARVGAIGYTFEFTFPLPEPSNAGGRPAKRKKPSRKATPKARQSKDRPELPLAEVEARRQEQLEYDRQRSTTPERREYNRLQAQERRRLAKESGLCRDCPNPAAPDRTRCESCAEEHRVGRRKNDAQRRAAAKQTVAPGQQVMTTQP